MVLDIDMPHEEFMKEAKEIRDKIKEGLEKRDKEIISLRAENNVLKEENKILKERLKENFVS